MLSGSFLTPFTAHLVVQTQVLLFALAGAPDGELGAMNRKPFTKCPACRTRLSVKEVNLDVSETFFCPNCHTRLTSSDRRRRFCRWGGAVLIGVIWFATSEGFPDLIFSTNYWIFVPLYLFSGMGLLLMLHVALPLTLEFGDPDFAGLNLNDKSAARSEEEKPKSQNSIPITPRNKTARSAMPLRRFPRSK